MGKKVLLMWLVFQALFGSHSALAQSKAGTPMTIYPDRDPLIAAIMAADENSDQALREYTFWLGAHYNDALYYAFYLASMTDSSTAHYYIFFCLEQLPGELSKLDDRFALDHLCISFKKGNPEAKSSIIWLYQSRQYDRYDYCDSLCRDCKYFPYRGIYGDDITSSDSE